MSFFKIISILATLFGIVPCCDYREGTLIYRKLYRCYALFIVCGLSSCYAASFYYRFEYQSISIAKTMHFLVDITGLVLCLVFMLGSSLWNTKIWERLMRQLSRFEKKKNSLVPFILGSVFYVSLDICNYLSMGREILCRHIIEVALHSIKFLFMIIMHNVTISVRAKYEDLKEMLLSVKSVRASRMDVVDTIRKVGVLSLEVNSAVDTFNSFFGWPILFLLAHCLVQILFCLSLLLIPKLMEIPIADFVTSCHMIENVVSTLTMQLLKIKNSRNKLIN